MRRAAARHVAQGVHGPRQVGQDAEQRARVQASGLEQHLADRSAERGRVVGVADARVRQNVAHQREAIAVQTARRDRDDQVAMLDALRAEHRIRLDGSHRGARDVVLVRLHQARVLRGLAAHQRGAGLGAGARDPLDQGGDPVRVDLAAGDVVGHEQRLRADHDDVVDDHADQVLPDRVVLVERDGDVDLRADAVGARRQQRAAEFAQRAHVEQAGEVSRADRGLHQLDRAVARGGVDSGGGVAGVAMRTGCGGHTARVVARRTMRRRAMRD